MNISYKWLCDYLPQSVSEKNVSDLLTQIGLEVEEVEQFQSIRGGLEHVVIGCIEKIEAISNADRIKLTRVRIKVNSDELLDVVCGAPNVERGALVVVALPGATLYPTGGEPFKIRKSKIRGLVSNGMLCSEKEIGLGNNGDGIMLIRDDIPVGTKASTYFDVYQDTVFKINLTPNRSDSMSHFGVARDICAYWSYHQNKIVHPVKPPTKDIQITQDVDTTIAIEIKDSYACARYSILDTNQLIVKVSPSWLCNRLLAIGQQPINNIVDITNYILHELGQPLHAFDKKAILGDKIIIQKNVYTDFVTLDSKSRKLKDNDLMICNLDSPMCIAGVFGGLASGVTDETTEVVFESAFFDPQTIRKTSLHHQLRTEAATHFEKRVDINQTVFALKRLAYLLEKLMNIKLDMSIVDIYPQPFVKKPIQLSLEYIDKLAGRKYESDRIEHLLLSLGFEVDKVDATNWNVVPPTFKSDIDYPADVAEEVIRIDGLDNIPIPTHSTIIYNTEPLVSLRSLHQTITPLLCGMGFYELIHNSIVHSTFYEDYKEGFNFVSLLNNLSADHDLMRPSMMESGLKSIAFNLNRKHNSVKFFEMGKTYTKLNAGNYHEFNQLALWVSGDWKTPHWQNSQGDPTTYYHLMGVVESLSSLFNLANTTTLKPKVQKQYSQCSHFNSHNNRWAFVGELNHTLLERFDINQQVWYAEIDMDFVLSHITVSTTIYQETPKFHAVRRDIAFFVDSSIDYATIKAKIEHLKVPFLKRFILFDLFQPTGDKSTQLSLGIRFFFESKNKTLTDQEVSASVQKIMFSLEQTFSAKMRKS